MNINIQAPIGTTGYGYTSLNIVKALHKLGHRVALFPIGKIELSNADDMKSIQECYNNQARYDPNAPSIRLFHQFSLAERIGKGPHIGFPIFELDKFTDREKHHLTNCDELLVTCGWAKDIIQAEIGKTAHVCPLGVDTTIFFPAHKEPTHKTIFLNVGKWETRKGHDILWKIFCQAFTIEDDVELWLMPSNPFLTDDEVKDWERLYDNCPLWSKIKILKRVKDHKEVAEVMNQADFGIFPARAEGWNMELLEMMACGKPSIVSEYSAHLEYITNKNSSKFRIFEKELAYGKTGTESRWFYGQGQWAKIDDIMINKIAHWMRNCHINKEDFIKKSPFCLQAAQKFSWENSAKSIEKALTLIQNKVK